MCTQSSTSQQKLLVIHFDFYRNLRVTNPSNYLYFYDFGDYQIIGASPESLVSVKNGIVTTNPIAVRDQRATDEGTSLGDRPTF